MPADNLPTWVHYLQALVVPAVAIVGSVIALGQLALARRRMQLDVYDRRYKIFESARRLIAEIVREGRAENEWIFAYHRDSGDAIFLFKSDVANYVTELTQLAQFWIKRGSQFVAAPLWNQGVEGLRRAVLACSGDLGYFLEATSQI